MSDGLFDLGPAQVHPDPLAGLSYQKRLTVRQKSALEQGQHPLSLLFGHLPLHPEAAPADDRKTDGRRCRNCTFHSANAWGYPQCDLRARKSHGAATDCRGWWPACSDHQYESEDADA